MTALELGPPEFQRWYILVVSSLTSALQCNTWFTFSSVPSQIEEYYHLQRTSHGEVNQVIDLLLNWGPIMAFPSIPLTAYILLFPLNGLQYSVRLSITLIFFGCLIRSIPTILTSIGATYEINNSFWNTLIFLHCGQILNAIAGVIIMSVPSKLSVIWFPQNERKFATSCVGIAASMGSCFGFLCGPYVVETANDVPLMLYLDLLLAFIPFLCIIIYFPTSPTKLPSKAAKCALLSIRFQETVHNGMHMNVNEQLIEKNNPNIDSAVVTNNNLHKFWTEVKSVFASKDTMLAVIIGGLQSGLAIAYNGVTQDMLSPLGFTDKYIGVIGFVQTGMNILGGLVVGWIADKYFSKQLKKLIYVVLGVSAMVCVLLVFVVPSPWCDGSMIFAHSNGVVITMLLTALGFTSGPLLPLFYELCSEVAYPHGISEGTASTLLVLSLNATCLVFIGVGNWIGTKYETIASVVVYLTCIGLLYFVKEIYKRYNI
eukprot:978921_1